MNKNSQILKLIFGKGDFKDKEEIILNCKVGDKTFNKYLTVLNAVYKNDPVEYPAGITRQELFYNKQLKKIPQGIHKFNNPFFFTMANNRKRPDEKSSFEGLPLSIFESHRHSYNILTNILKKSKEKITIVRLDSHSDCMMQGEDIIKSNYLYKLMQKPELREKIVEIYTISGTQPDFSGLYNQIEYKGGDKQVFYDHKVKHTFIKAPDLPEIKGPAVLDIDLDGLEVVVNNPQKGGIINQNINTEIGSDISLHPNVATEILKESIKNPKAIMIATERSYRIKEYHKKMELDFIASLSDKLLLYSE